MNEEKLIETAAVIMAGLLASSDYTQSGDYFPKPNTKLRYRPEVVDDAITLARALIAKTKGLETSPTTPANAS